MAGHEFILGPGCGGSGHLRGALLPVMAETRKALSPRLGTNTLSLPPHPNGQSSSVAGPKQRTRKVNPVCAGRSGRSDDIAWLRAWTQGGRRNWSLWCMCPHNQTAAIPCLAMPCQACLASFLLSPCLISSRPKSGRP